jgi:hypothetical protein
VRVLGIDRRTGPSADPLRDALDLAAVAVSVGLLGLVAEHANGPPRILLALAFAFFAPGRAIVTNWPRIAYWSEFGMSLVLSLTVLTLVATTTLWAHEWHPVGIFEIEALVSVVAVAVGMARRHQRDVTEPSHRARPEAPDRRTPSGQPRDGLEWHRRRDPDGLDRRTPSGQPRNPQPRNPQPRNPPSRYPQPRNPPSRYPQPRNAQPRNPQARNPQPSPRGDSW